MDNNTNMNNNNMDNNTNAYNNNNMNNNTNAENNRLARFLLTFFLGWIGSFIINHSSFKPEGYTSRTSAYFFMSIITFGIYALVASICNLTFNPNASSNIGYKRD